MTSLDQNLNTANRRFSFKSAGMPDATFSVVEMTGIEGVSQNFRFEVTLVSDEASIDFEKMLSNPAQFSIFSVGGTTETAYHGVLQAFEQLQQVDKLSFYSAVLIPRLERLAMYRTSDVYLNGQTIPDVLKAVLDSSAMTSADYEFKTHASYRQRDLVCQYQETNLDFLARWMQKEGLYYYFDHSGSAEKTVIVDDKSALPATVANVSYRPIENMSSSPATDSIQSFFCRQKLMPKRVILQGFNYLKADIALREEAEVSSTGTGDVMLYGENFLDADEGKHYASVRAQEINCRQKVFVGEATAVGLRSGYFMQLGGHFRTDVNGKYLVTQIEHRGSQAGILLAGLANSYQGKSAETNYFCTFEAMPADVQFRPERKVARPHIANTISAVIDSSGSGQYADMDEMGRYKVQMPFIKTGKTAGHGSARIRMATPYSGSNHGMNFPLHKGAEVLLSFIDGDPDQPVIVNAVPNSANLSIVTGSNPTQSLIQTAGGNQILMDDQQGKEVVYITSPYQNSALVIGNSEGRTSTVGRDGKDGAAGAAGAKGDTGAAGAKGDTGAAGAKGDAGTSAPAPSPYPGIWASTGGSSESVTVGTSNAIKVGFNNTIGLSVDNSITGSISNKLAVGSSASFTYGKDMAWKSGRSITLDDGAESISLKNKGKLKGNDSVVISGGQADLLQAAVDSAKKTVKLAVGLSLGFNLVAAAGAGAAINRLGTEDKKAKLDFHDKSAGNNLARGLGVASGVGTAVAMQSVLSSLASSLGELTDPKLAYTSNMKLDSTGVTIDATPPLPLVGNKGQVLVQPNSVEIISSLPAGVGDSRIGVTPTKVELQGCSPLTPSMIELDSAGAAISTHAAGEVSLIQRVGGSVKLGANGLVAESFTSKLTLSAASVKLVNGPDSTVVVSPTKVGSDCGLSHMKLTPTTASLTMDSGAGFSVNASGCSIAGALVRLG